jgi:hypothetical protein
VDSLILSVELTWLGRLQSENMRQETQLSSVTGRVSTVDATNGVAGSGAETSGPGISGAAGASMVANKLKKLRHPGKPTKGSSGGGRG